MRSIWSAGATLQQGRIGVGRTRRIAAGLLWLQEKTHAKELRITGVPTAINVSDVGAKILSKARMKGLKHLIKMVDGDNEKIGSQESEQIHAKEELKKNIGKLAKAVGGHARIALVLALTMLQGGKASEMHEAKENEMNDESWWIRPLLTLVCLADCLAAIGALSLTRWLWEKGRQWFNGRRVHADQKKKNSQNSRN